MKKVIYNIYNLYIELYCIYWFYENLHNNNKIIPIKDEETLKKENINIKDYIKEFDESAKNVITIKDKIENENKKINELYEKMELETTESFKLKHDKLKEEEKEMKEQIR